jgi:flagellar motility protein MotE (MotC chaperone)
LALVSLSGCSRLYYAAMEKVGKEKREILAERVGEGQKAQLRAKEQFQTTLEAFQELTGFEGGELEKIYKKLNRQYECSENRAQAVRERVRGIEDVAERLFREWDKENSEIETETPHPQPRTVRSHRGPLPNPHQKMKDAEAGMEPVLTAHRDQVLFLKHNLNAQVIESLKATVGEIDDDVAVLVSDLEESIREADEFIASLES